MSARRQLAKGFTLVEILIVVVILGILAAIVIPQFTSASETAKASSLVSQLQTIRSQLELYQVQHNGQYPDLVTDWQQLTGTTDADGVRGNAGYGPYLQKAPSNAFMDSDTVAATAADGIGWVYNQTTGEITAVLPASVNPDELGLDADDYEQLATGV